MLLGPPSAVQVKLTSELLVLRISVGVIITLTEATKRKRKESYQKVKLYIISCNNVILESIIFIYYVYFAVKSIKELSPNPDI